jgi:hypothetical protein
LADELCGLSRGEAGIRLEEERQPDQARAVIFDYREPGCTVALIDRSTQQLPL